MPGRCRPKAAKILGEAEPDALAHLGSLQPRREGPRASDAREGTDGETKRRSRVVQVPPSVGSLTRLVGAVMCERDEEWPESRHLSEKKDLGTLRGQAETHTAHEGTARGAASHRQASH